MVIPTLWHEADQKNDPKRTRVHIPAECCDAQEIEQAHQAEEWEQDAKDFAVRSATAATIQIARHAYPRSGNRHDYPGKSEWKLMSIPHANGENDEPDG